MVETDYKYMDQILHQLDEMKTESLSVHVRTFNYDNFKRKGTSELPLKKIRGTNR